MQRYVFFLNLQALRRFFLKKFSLKPLGFSFFFCTNKRKTETKRKFAGYVPKLLSLKPRGLFISFSRKKETKQRKFAGYVPEAKICTFFLKKKNSFHSNSFFFLTEKRTNFLTLLHSCRKLLGWMVTKRCFARFWGALRMFAECASLVFGCPADGCRTLLRFLGMYSDPSSLRSSGWQVQTRNEQENNNEQRAKQCCAKTPASSFLAWNGGGCWSVKNKKLFERSEFFLFSGNSRGNSQKSAAGAFSLFRFFWASNRNERPVRPEHNHQLKTKLINYEQQRKQQQKHVEQDSPRSDNHFNRHRHHLRGDIMHGVLIQEKGHFTKGCTFFLLIQP